MSTRKGTPNNVAAVYVQEIRPTRREDNPTRVDVLYFYSDGQYDKLWKPKIIENVTLAAVFQAVLEDVCGGGDTIVGQTCP